MIKVLNNRTRAVRTGVYKITFVFSTITENHQETMFLYIETIKKISELEAYLNEEVVETLKEGSPLDFIKKENITEKPMIETIEHKPEFFYADY